MRQHLLLSSWFWRCKILTLQDFDDARFWRCKILTLQWICDYHLLTHLCRSNSVIVMKIHSARTHQSVPVQICDRHKKMHVLYTDTSLQMQLCDVTKDALCTDTSMPVQLCDCHKTGILHWHICAATILWSSQNVHAALTHLCSYNYVIITYWHIFADAFLWLSQNAHSVLTHLCSYNSVIVTKDAPCTNTSLELQLCDRHKTYTLYWHIFVATILWLS